MSNQTIDSVNETKFYFICIFKWIYKEFIYNTLQVVEFCKDDQVLSHVYGAPNKHNAMCGARSVWTVITSHPDFSDDQYT